MTHSTLESLTAGQAIVFGGNRVTTVPPELAAAFAPGDRLVVVQDTGDLLHVPATEHLVVNTAVSEALAGFAGLARCTEQQISAFFAGFAQRLADEAAFAPIAAANDADVVAARADGRSTTRLELTASMRRDMIDGLGVWERAASGRDGLVESVEHDGWRLDARRAPLGVVAFVFEGRPNVFADACGVLRSGNAVVFRIGSDALGTARAIVEHALVPALDDAGLPIGAVRLVDSPSRSAGHALFSDQRLALAVARGSGRAVAQLGAVASQAGIPVSLHGTGGAWMVAGEHA
ncbi:MAG: aldehyde dehydrogenase family protein, partial [Ilumatobacter sp.]